MLKPVLAISVAFFFSFNVFSQWICKDSSSIYYSQNDGSCKIETTKDSLNLIGVFPGNIAESSGLEFTSGLLFTHNDSGNAAEFYSIDTANTKILQTIIVDNYQNIDWEDITADADFIYIGDVGNNNGDRKNLKVLKIAKTDFIGKGKITHVNAQAISYSYADQTDFTENSLTNFDCESMMVMGSYIYLFSKEHSDFHTRVYRLSKTPGIYSISPYTSFNVNGEITGADYNSALNEVALIGYQIGKTNSFIYLLNNFQGDLFFSGNSRRIEIGKSGIAWQTEGITYATQNKLFISCEINDGIDASLFSFNRVSITTGLFASKNTNKDLRSYPNPAIDKLTIENKEVIKDIEIKNTLGITIFTSKVNNFTYELDISNLNCNNGSYIICVSTDNQIYYLPVIFQ